jgi:hypothetical protein
LTRKSVAGFNPRNDTHPEFVRAYRTEERRDAATRTRQTRAQRRLANAKKQSAR